MISTSNESPRIRDIIINKIETSKPNTRILTEIKNKIASLYNNSTSQNKPLDANLSVLKHIEDNNSISKNIGSICNLNLVDKDILSAMIDIHHREKKKNHLAIICYSNTLKEINVKATDKEIKLTNEFIKLSSKIEEGRTIINRTIIILNEFFQNCKNKMNKTPELQEKINEYEKQKTTLLNSLKNNEFQESNKIDIERKVIFSTKYNEVLNKNIEELKLIALDYTSVLEENDKFKSGIDNNKLLEVINNHIEKIKTINTNHPNI